MAVAPPARREVTGAGLLRTDAPTLGIVRAVVSSPAPLIACATGVGLARVDAVGGRRLAFLD